ncbi:unnamed protein product [Arabis nemorensis]|uniref:Uncharacterized protein n=1 Tax=Arabis nemorensis TaxID=586526 RepID=A0A565BNQ7_9BRAS|nr:unnamed protein product [Arabis nemorensis]
MPDEITKTKLNLFYAAACSFAKITHLSARQFHQSKSGRSQTFSGVPRRTIIPLVVFNAPHCTSTLPQILNKHAPPRPNPGHPRRPHLSAPLSFPLHHEKSKAWAWPISRLGLLSFSSPSSTPTPSKPRSFSSRFGEKTTSISFSFRKRSIQSPSQFWEIDCKNSAFGIISSKISPLASIVKRNRILFGFSNHEDRFQID